MAAFSGGKENEYFYASLYAGLYYESQVTFSGDLMNVLLQLLF